MKRLQPWRLRVLDRIMHLSAKAMLWAAWRFYVAPGKGIRITLELSSDGKTWDGSTVWTEYNEVGSGA